MEFLEGAPFDSVIADAGKLNYARAVPIFMQIADAFAHAHGKGVIHRDLKPSNVILRTKAQTGDSVCVVDFGLAKFTQDSGMETTSLTTTGHIFGSPPYMSPEQCRGEKLDVRADIYSLGCLMYEALTGRPPLEAESSVATVVKQLTDLPAPLNKFANVPPTLEALVLKALEKEPGKRQQSMIELSDELKSFVGLMKSGLEYKPIELTLQIQEQWNRHTKVIATLLGGAAIVLLITWLSWYQWLTQWHGYEFVPRLFASLFVLILIGFSAYKLWQLDLKMRARELDSLVPALKWLEEPALLGIGDGMPAARRIAECVENASEDGALVASEIRDAARVLISGGKFDDVAFGAGQGLEILKKKNDDTQSFASVALKEVLADALSAKGEHSRAEAIYREVAYPIKPTDLEIETRNIELKLADSLYRQSRFADAQTLYSCCLFAANRLGVERDRDYTLRLSRLGDCYLNIDSFKLAEENYVSAMALWKELGHNANKSLAFIKYAYTSNKRFMPVKADTSFAAAVAQIKESFGANTVQYEAAVKLYASLLWKEGALLPAISVRGQVSK
jgi:tetratricopeptide (TPR) repeat protein